MIEIRFFSKVKIAGLNECWEWQAYKNKFGYGLFNVNYYATMAHRVSWELNNGPIPKGLYVLHKCDNPCCVNPNHLWLGTYKDNMRDCVAKGRYVSHNKNKTHCPNGHEYSEENTYWYTEKNGRRRRRNCRACGASVASNKRELILKRSLISST